MRCYYNYNKLEHKNETPECAKNMIEHVFFFVVFWFSCEHFCLLYVFTTMHVAK